MRLFSLSSVLILLAYNGSTFVPVYGADSELYPPGLLPLIDKANILLSTGQFNEAAKAYSEAIGKTVDSFLYNLGYTNCLIVVIGAVWLL